MSSLNERLKEIGERAEKAAPAPWNAHDPGMYCGHPCTPDGCYENHPSHVRQLEGPYVDWPEPNGGPVDDGTLQCFTADDASFIAAARTDVPALLRAIRVLVEQRDRLIENSLRERVILPDTFDAMFSHRVGASNAAVLAAMDAKETT